MYRDWGINGDDIALFNQEFAGLEADLAHLDFWYRTTCTELRNGSGRCSIVSRGFCEFDEEPSVACSRTCPSHSLPPATRALPRSDPSVIKLTSLALDKEVPSLVASFGLCTSE